MNYINLKQKLDRTLYCKEKKCIIKISECTNCPYKEYKEHLPDVGKMVKMHNKTVNTVQKSLQKSLQTSAKLQSNVDTLQKNSRKSTLKRKTYKLAKMERERFSLFTDDLDHCIICGKSPINKHEIFFGAKNRQKSIQYGLVIPLCTAEHHNQIGCTGIHFDKKLREYWQIKAQKKFQEVYPDLDFLEIFGKNYIK